MLEEIKEGYAMRNAEELRTIGREIAAKRTELQELSRRREELLAVTHDAAAADDGWVDRLLKDIAA